MPYLDGATWRRGTPGESSATPGQEVLGPGGAFCLWFQFVQVDLAVQAFARNAQRGGGVRLVVLRHRERAQDQSFLDVTQRRDLLAIAGDASRPSVLERAGIRGADLAIAVTDSDTSDRRVSPAGAASNR